MKIRVGFGYDVHAFVADRELWLGGIRIEHSMGLQGHSDADVLIHAICDALLGAANMRDIGYHFPDTAEEYEGIDSKVLLYETMELLRDAGYTLGNIDATEIESAYPGDEADIGRSDGSRCRGYIHQSDYHRKAGFHRTPGRDSRLCYCLDSEMIMSL